MPNNLSDAFKAAKKDRGVLSKHVIWESGVSKTQFYRILSGEETPSPETKKNISKSLNIDSDEFDRLHKQSKKTPEKSLPIEGPKSKRVLPILAASILVIGLGVLALNAQRSGPTPNTNVASQEDSTLFIEDVTIPDGTPIPINTKFVKTWRVKNTGKIIWKDRYLKRVTPASSLLCSSPSMVPIPETKPGEIVDISVTFITPYLPGTCRTDWKTSDKDGNLFYPDMHPLYSIVTVVATDIPTLE